MSAPRGSFAASSSAFLRLLAVVHLIAFGSFWRQWQGLVGPEGILPAGRWFAVVKQQIGAAAYLRLPSLCWWVGTNHGITVLCVLGMVAAVLLFVGVAPAWCLCFLWADYLSLLGAGQVFYEFQWDALLLEATLLAIFLAPWQWLPGWKPYEPPRLARWLLWWLLFRLMVLSGAVKLASQDPTWWHLTALTVHFQTQPLPTPVAWYADHLPLWCLRSMCAAMFAIELLVPCFIWAPRRWRHAAAWLLILLQVAIAITGNYTFFNLLTAALCVLLFEVRRVEATSSSPSSRPPARALIAILRPFALVVVALTSIAALSDFFPALADSTSSLDRMVAPLRSFNNYGLFARMTTTRPELIFEGSDDGRNWKAYAFPYQAGDLAQRPRFVAPAQPRLDWQLWFAALEPPEYNRWVDSLVAHLLRNTPAVLALLAHNPFPGRPPKLIRVVLYDYRFTTPAERKATGNWWSRSIVDLYLPPSSLNTGP